MELDFSILNTRANLDAQYRARKAANDRLLGIGRDATAEQVHAAIVKAAKPMRFAATCHCGGRITGDTHTWRHDKAPAKRHTASPVGSLTQI